MKDRPTLLAGLTGTATHAGYQRQAGRTSASAPVSGRTSAFTDSHTSHVTQIDDRPRPLRPRHDPLEARHVVRPRRGGCAPQGLTRRITVGHTSSGRRGDRFDKGRTAPDVNQLRRHRCTCLRYRPEPFGGVPMRSRWVLVPSSTGVRGTPPGVRGVIHRVPSDRRSAGVHHCVKEGRTRPRAAGDAVSGVEHGDRGAVRVGLGRPARSGTHLAGHGVLLPLCPGPAGAARACGRGTQSCTRCPPAPLWACAVRGGAVRR